MKDFRSILVRIRWRMLIRDLISVICWMAALPATVIFYEQNFCNVQIEHQEMAGYYWNVLVMCIPIVLLAWLGKLIIRKKRIYYMYIPKEDRVLFTSRGIRVHTIIDSKGRDVYKVQIRKKAAVDFIITVMNRYNLLSQESCEMVNIPDRSDLEHWADEYCEWIVETKR